MRRRSDAVRGRRRDIRPALSGPLLAVALLAGCGAPDVPPATPGSPDGPGGGVGLANPASEHCVAQGGTLEILDGPDGQTGWCTLPDGRRVEEWELYREAQEAGTPAG